MAIEIERKFLVSGDEWRAAATSSRHFRQGYLATSGTATVRIRIDGDSAAWLTVKASTAGAVRSEFEYAIPVADADAMLALCVAAPIVKTRYLVPAGDHTWEIDVFDGANAGLVIAEIELEDPDENFEHPAWLAAEVTDDQRYYNAKLAARPYASW